VTRASTIPDTSPVNYQRGKTITGPVQQPRHAGLQRFRPVRLLGPRPGGVGLECGTRRGSSRLHVVEHRRLPPQYRRQHGDVRRDDRIRTPRGAVRWRPGCCWAARLLLGGPVAAGGGNNIRASLFATRLARGQPTIDVLNALQRCASADGAPRIRPGLRRSDRPDHPRRPQNYPGRQPVPERNADRGAARPREHPCRPRVQVGRLARIPHPSLMPLARRGICWCCTRLLRPLPIGTYPSPSDWLLRNRSSSTDRTATRSGSSRHRNRLDQVVSPAGRNRVTMRVRVS